MYDDGITTDFVMYEDWNIDLFDESHLCQTSFVGGLMNKSLIENYFVKN
jgi:hypothetical protein